LQAQAQKLKEIIAVHSRFILTTHINPDGDGLGCEVALAIYLKSKGKQATILNCSATPGNYLFLDQIYPVVEFDHQKHEKMIKEAEVIFVLDINHTERLSDMDKSVISSRAKKICIDHHPEPKEFADLYILDEQSSSTGEIIYNLLVELGDEIKDIGIAAALYTAIMTDTGSFRFPKTSPAVHDIISHLLRSGADPSAIYEKVYESGSAGRMRLLGMALAGLKLMYGGKLAKLAYIIVDQEMFDKTGTSEEDTDAFVPYTLGVDGVRIGLMFSELNGIIKVSFRSKGNIPINELAKEFSGNGHLNAAGARIAGGKLEDVMKNVLQRAEKYF
jgi:bifunctional oligoribonuclease and PAP phosphatase NrnA